MKQETKSKIKKALKWTGFAVLCAFASFGAVVACSLIARSANGAETQNTAESSATKAPAPINTKRALFDTSDAEQSDNLLDGAQVVRDVLLARVNNQPMIQYFEGRAIYRVPLAAGFTYVLNGTADSRVNYCVDNAGGYTWVAAQQVATDHETIFLPSDGYVTYDSLVSGASAYIDGTLGRFLLVSFNVGYYADVKVYAVQSMKALATYSLPENWNPYALLGAEPSPNHDGTFVGGVGSVNFDAVTFRSNGFVWNNIYVETLDMEQKLVGWYDVNGKLQYKRVTATGAKAVASVTYSLTGQSTQASQVVMQYKRVLIEVDGSSEYVYLAQGARYWTSPLYRNIDVLIYNADEWSPSSEYLPATPDLWLERSLADKTTFDPNAWGDPNENVNVFTMIALAFSSMMPFLGIQIFPSMTLGLLIVLPLIGGIIILIIKAVSK